MPRADIAAIATEKIAQAKEEHADENFTAELRGGIAFVKAPGKYDNARAWAQRNYPVAVICDPEYILEGTAIQVCRRCVIRQEGTFDRHGFERLVNEAEAKKRGLSLAELRTKGLTWGGPKNIVSSPKGHNTPLTEEEILAIARTCAESGVVS